MTAAMQYSSASLTPVLLFHHLLVLLFLLFLLLFLLLLPILPLLQPLLSAMTYVFQWSKWPFFDILE